MLSDVDSSSRRDIVGIVGIEGIDEVIKRTKKCHANFSCLNDKENPKCPDGLAMCSVENNIVDGMVFVNFNNDLSCQYSTQYGIDKRICSCPVRYEIYKHYQM